MDRHRTVEEVEDLRGRWASDHPGPKELYIKWPLLSLAVALILLGGMVDSLAFYQGHEQWFFFFWLHLPAVLLHHFEENMFSGGFRRWFNREVFHSRNTFFPLSRKGAFFLYFPTTLFFLTVAAWIGVLWPWVGMAALFASMFHAYLHLGFSFTARRYIPGLITSMVFLLPVSISAAYLALSRQWISWIELVCALSIGVVLNAFIPLFLKGLTQKMPEFMEAPPERE